MINEYLINGPNNVIRLTNGDKILYIFGDYHLNYQRECELNDNYESLDFDKLLFKFMKEEKNKQFDLFIEDNKKNFNQEFNETYRDIHIIQIRKLFRANIIMEKNKILINKKYKNFRFHYFDIRDNLELFDIIRDYCNIVFPFPYTLLEYRRIIDMTNIIINSLENIYINYKNNLIIKKILNKYDNKKIQSKINNIFDKLFIKNIKNAIKNSKELINIIIIFLPKIKETYNSIDKSFPLSKDIYVKFENNKILLMNIGCIITDLYFLRRFLDKSYITNTILYTGSGHMVDIMYLLVKYFNYKLTHCYFLNKPLTNDKIIKFKSNELKYIDDLLDIFTNYDNYYNIKQCINLFNFPKNFN